MEKHAFNLQLMNRKFPVRATVEEGETLKAAARRINQKVEEYKGRYNVKEEVYLALMCCLDLAADNERLRLRLQQTEEAQAEAAEAPTPSEASSEEVAELREKITALHELLGMSWEELQQHAPQASAPHSEEGGEANA